MGKKRLILHYKAWTIKYTRWLIILIVKCSLVVFICNHCPYVKARIGDIKDLQTKFTPSELQIISINSNDPSL